MLVCTPLMTCCLWQKRSAFESPQFQWSQWTSGILTQCCTLFRCLCGVPSRISLLPQGQIFTAVLWEDTVAMCQDHIMDKLVRCKDQAMPLLLVTSPYCHFGGWEAPECFRVSSLHIAAMTPTHLGLPSHLLQIEWYLCPGRGSNPES